MKDLKEKRAEELLRDIISFTELVDHEPDFEISGVIMGYKFDVSISIRAEEQSNGK